MITGNRVRSPRLFLSTSSIGDSHSVFSVRTLKLNPGALYVNVFAARNPDAFGTAAFGVEGVLLVLLFPLSTCTVPCENTRNGSSNSTAEVFGPVFTT